MDLLLSWIVFGSLIGFMSDIAGLTPDSQRFPLSMVFGVAGATLGGSLGSLINDVTFAPVPPLLYVLVMALFAVVLPKSLKSRRARVG